MSDQTNDQSNGQLAGKHAIVLGASSGIGEAIARRYAAEGASVVVAARRTDRIAALATEINGVAIACDITDETEIEALVSHSLDRYGRIDVAVNTAGQSEMHRIKDVTAQHLRQMAEVHFVGVALFVKHVAGAMQRGGVILSTSSLSAMPHYAVRGLGAYSGSKIAGDKMLRVAANEYGPRGIRINILVPGLVMTEMPLSAVSDPTQRDSLVGLFTNETPLGQIATPDAIAAMAVLMARDDWFDTGQHIQVNGGASLRNHP